MISQVRFALLLYRHSGRWLAPLALLMVWFLFAIENAPEAFSTLAALFPALLVFACWIAVSLGDVDDRNHREMAAAAAGSRGRLHRARSLASLVVCMAAAVPQTIYISLMLEQPEMAIIAVFLVCLATLFGASALGAAIGSWLHPPLVLRRAISVVVGFGSIVLILLFGPLQEALRKLGASEVAPALVLALVAVGTAAVAIVGSSTAVERSNH